MKNRKQQLQTVITNLEKRVATYRKRLIDIQVKEGEEQLKEYIGKCYYDKDQNMFLMVTHTGKRGDPEGIYVGVSGKGKNREASLFTHNYISWDTIKCSKEVSRVRFKVELNRAIGVVTSKIKTK